jgi:hypothetical protein
VLRVFWRWGGAFHAGKRMGMLGTGGIVALD